MYLTAFFTFLYLIFIFLSLFHVGDKQQSLYKRLGINTGFLLLMLVVLTFFLGFVITIRPVEVALYVMQFSSFGIGNYLMILPLLIIISLYTLYAFRKNNDFGTRFLFLILAIVISNAIAFALTFMVALIPHILYLTEGLKIMAVIAIITHIVWLIFRDKNKTKESEKTNNQVTKKEEEPSVVWTVDKEKHKNKDKSEEVVNEVIEKEKDKKESEITNLEVEKESKKEETVKAENEEENVNNHTIKEKD